MKWQNYLSTFRHSCFLLICFLTSGLSAQIVQTFTHTGAVQTFVVPACVTTITVDASGGAGGEGGKFTSSTATIAARGKGGRVQATLPVTPGQTLYIYVGGAGVSGNNTAGGAGGFNGGGLGRASTGSGGGGGGGGASDVRQGGTALSDRILVAAGGGGGGGSGSASSLGGNGGDGGGTTGTAGANGSSAYGIGGGGGTQLAGGAMGGNQPGSTNGALGMGGDGSGPLSNGSGGGGGGGYYGGGGGGTNLCSGCTTSSGAGGGGSSYVDASATGVVHTPGVQTGNGVVTFTYDFGGGGMMSASASNTLICNGTGVSITASSASSYTWLPVGSFPGSNAATITHTPATTTAYTVQGTSSSTCISTIVLTISVNQSAPVLTVTSSTTQLCLGKTATLTATGANTYTWTNGVINGVSFFPSATTTYTVSGENGCGITTAVSTITVSPLAMTAVSTSTAICTNKTATLSVTAAATSYTWEPGTIIGTNTTIIVNPSVTTIYTVTASDGTCSGMATIPLQADPVPTITASASSTVLCPGGSINLTASGGNNYTWTPVNLNGSSITVTPVVSTLYNVVGDNNFGCLGNASQVIVVGVKPNVILNSSPSTICKGGTATLTASGADTYSWSNTFTTATNIVTLNQSTDFTVVGTNSSSGCTDTQTISVSVLDPIVTVTGNTAICLGGSSSLSATAPGATSFIWNPGNIPFAGISVSPLTTTIYTVSTISSSNSANCLVTATIEVVVNPNPTITTSAALPAICAKETNTLSANGAITYTWISTSTTVASPSITISSNVATILVYTISGTNVHGCENSITLPLSIFACTDIDESAVDTRQLAVYPNPSSETVNIAADCAMNLSLVNNLGQLIRKIELNEGNNHRTIVSSLPAGVYFIVGSKGAEIINHKIVVSN